MSKGNRNKFIKGQTVVFRFGQTNLVGKIVASKPNGKKTVYDVHCENGKIYEDLLVDTTMNQCIDTRLTKLFYEKHGINEFTIPEHLETEEPELAVNSTQESLEEPEFDDYSEHRPYSDPDEVLFDPDDSED